MYKVSRNSRRGFLLALATAFLWAVLPIAIKQLIGPMDAMTLAWYRFLGASFVMGALVAYKHGMPKILGQPKSVIFLLALACVFLCANYVTYSLGVYYLSPSAATVVIQLAIVFFLIGSIVIFKERFSLVQSAGYVFVLLGLVLFFNDKLSEMLTSLTSNTSGFFLVSLSAFFWAVYGLAQKKLLDFFPSESIIWMICVGASVFLYFPSKPAQITSLSALQLWLLVFCALNTVLAYGCFAASLKYWEASRIGATIAQEPIMTIILVKALHALFPNAVAANNLNLISVAGSLIVVAGATICALSRTSGPRKIEKMGSNLHLTLH